MWFVLRDMNLCVISLQVIIQIMGFQSGNNVNIGKVGGYREQ